MDPADLVDPGLSLRAALELPEMLGTEVVAGAQGLDRTVTGVNIIEVPDVSRWLRGGELLFTAGYVWRSRPSDMVDAIQEFNRRHVSGLVVKLGTYIPELPVEVRRTADEMGFPIIRLPKSVAYMDIIDPLNEQLKGRRLRMFERLHEAEQRLLGLGLDDQSIERVAGVLAHEIRNRVYVVDLIDDVVVRACPDGTSQTLPGDSLGGETAGIASRIQLAELPRRRSLTRQDLGNGVSGLCTPLVVSREVRGAVVAAEDAGTLDDLAQHTIVRGAELISFLLLKRLANLEGQRASMALLVRSLFEDRLTKEEAVERALAFGLRLSQPCHVLVVGPSDALAPRQVDDLRRDLSRVLGTAAHAVGPDDNCTVALVQGRDGHTETSIDHVAERLLRVAQQHGLHRAVVAIGGAHSGLDGLRQSRVEALVVYRTQMRSNAGGLAHFSGLGVDGLLSQIPRSEITHLFVHAAIGPIADDPELIRTLQVYVESGGRKLATAAKLPLHRSSLEYRLDKITKLLGVDLTDPERRSRLWLALRLRELTED